MIQTPQKQSSFTHFWAAPYRPLFLAAAVWALLSIAWWPLGVGLGLPAPRFEPLFLWHAHEMIFGFAGAAVGGYLLTALPNWVKVEPEEGLVLQALLLLWVLARIAAALLEVLPAAWVVFVTPLYFVLLSATILWRNLSGGAWHKAGFGVFVLMIGGADAVFLARATGLSDGASLDVLNAMLTGFALLMVVIGAKAVPAFINTWLSQERPTTQAAKPLPMLRFLALACLLSSLIAPQAAWLQALAGVILLADMTRWQVVSSAENPLLLGLSLAFLWIPIGLLLMSALAYAPISYPLADARHALTIGAMSGLIMALSGRAASHTKAGPLKAPTWLIAAMILNWCATFTRLAAPMTSSFEDVLEICAALLFCLGWTSFLAAFSHTLKGPPLRPVLSGRPPSKGSETNSRKGDFQ